MSKECHVDISYCDGASELYGAGLCYATSGSAGVDLRAHIEEHIIIHPQERLYIPTGISIAMPHYIMGGIYSRSGLGSKYGIVVTQGVGVIDSDYRGEILVALTNRSELAYTIERGERIAQLVFHYILHPHFNYLESLDSTERGTGAFGSTGKE